ncbi:MAG: radical SAM/SPASM domain-containing protein [Desulfovibrio sp.]
MDTLNNIDGNFQKCICSALAGEEVVSHYPVDLVVQITSKCCINPPCLICDRNVRPLEGDVDLDPNLIPKLHEIFKYCDRALLYSGGEPLLAPNFFAVADMFSPPTKIRINTNGLLLNRKNIEKIVDNGCFEIINVSLDAGTPETYHRLRHHDLQRTLDNVKNLVQYRKDCGKKWPHIFLNMTICKSNLEDVALLPLIAAEVGAVAVDYSRLNEGLDFVVETESGPFSYKQEMIYDHDRCDELLLLAADRCRGLGIKMIFYGKPFYNSSLNRPDILADRRFPGGVDALLAGVDPYSHVDAPVRSADKCTFPWSEAVIAYNGDVTCCCFHPTGTSRIGNLFESDFMTIWNSAKAQSIRRQMFLSGKSGDCAMHCRYLRKNV